jgi:ribosomal protein S18 acetylase RimI-like enzyme
LFQVGPIAPGDRRWVEAALVEEFGSKRMAVRGRLYDPSSHEGFLCIDSGRPIGFVTHLVDDGQIEITAIATRERGRGAGTALIAAEVEEARRLGCQRVWLITTNDNLTALRFYQKRGFELVCIHRNAVNESRNTLKPEIPLTGADGIPLRDEIELEIRLTPA